MSSGTYSQNFDSLANSGTANTWMDNSTLIGWYASKSISPNSVTAYRADDGSGNTGALYSFGASGSTERALGSVASGTPGNFAYGIRFTNDTGSVQSNITVSYTGEQWRNGGNTSAQKLAFLYLVSSSPITNSDAVNMNSWTAFTGLDFTTPTTGATAGALDGNNPVNEQVFTNMLLPVVVLPGQEIVLRWFDANDSGFDHGAAVDNLTVSFSMSTNSPPSITTQPQSQTVNSGDNATFSVIAGGTTPLNYQWQSNNVVVIGATNSTFVLTSVTTNLTGSAYFVTITNTAGSTNSQIVTLTVNPPAPVVTSSHGMITILTYNIDGDSSSASNWDISLPLVQAQGRELLYLKPDIVTFNEVPQPYLYQMTNYADAFLPGYYLATNSQGDSFLTSVIASRFPILGSASYLHGTSLTAFGASGSSFTRDLFQATINVPGYPQPLDVFTAHLKATTTSAQTDATRRAAEAGAISNWFVTVYLPTNNGRPYTLSGDLNEDINRPGGTYTSGHPIQALTSPPTGLQLTTPLNPFAYAPTNDLTDDIQSTLDVRFDYILPCPMLSSNIVSSQVFRTDLLTGFPSNLFSNDDKAASDHLPVLMTFANPFDTPFRLLSFGVTNQTVTVKWESQNNRVFNIEVSTNLTTWTPFATNITTAATNATFTKNFTGSPGFFRLYRVP